MIVGEIILSFVNPQKKMKDSDQENGPFILMCLDLHFNTSPILYLQCLSVFLVSQYSAKLLLPETKSNCLTIHNLNSASSSDFCIFSPLSFLSLFPQTLLLVSHLLFTFPNLSYLLLSYFSSTLFTEP